MNNLTENESQLSSYMDLTNEFDDNEVIMNKTERNIDRPPRNYGKVNNLRSVQELPKMFQHIFHFPYFNIIQSTVMDEVLYSDKGIVVSAPTSSGKTVVFELAIIRLLMAMEDTNYSGSYKIIYVAPVKALCNERLSEWHSKFCKIGLSCIVVTGDTDIVNLSILDNYHIIITTPEKWDSLTRNVKDNNLFKDVKLFMIDEVHLLNEETRGPILEAIVCRLKILKQSEQIRFVAVSSTIPNIEDIAEWLGTDNNAAVHFKIDEQFRPVKLNKIVLGYQCKGDSSFKFDLSLNYKLQSVIMQYAEGKPSLIFCSTRKGVEMTAAHISNSITFHMTPEQKGKLQESAQKMLDNKMKIQLSNGVGCHHGGMAPANRLTIENLFRGGFLPVLITTSTLAMGVNLPAHLVIIKSTEFYTQGGFQDYSESSLMQMIGRAGRPQFDTSATVVIMTKSWQKEKYERMLGGTELIESNLHRHLTEHLNAEVVLGIISDIAVALDWIRQTFLYIRVQKNPKHYSIPTNYTKSQIEKKLQDLCQIEINSLNRHEMLQIDQTDGFSLYPTNMGKIMANYYLAFNTMKLFVQINGNECLLDILNMITKASEFSETYLRVNDKKTLNTLNRCKYQDTIRFPLPGNIKTSAMKVNCIIQATFGCLRIQDPSLLQESQKIMKIGERVSNCLVEYLIHKENCFNALLNALILNQCFHAKLWENSAHVSRQLHKIGTVLSSMLVTAGKTTFKSILEASPRAIELIINRSAPMGNQIQEEVLHLPFYKVKVDPPEQNNILKVKIIVTLLNPENIVPTCTAGLNSYMTLVVGDSENHILCCKKLFHNTMAVCKEYVQYVDVVYKVDHVIRSYLVSQNWVGIDCQDKVNIIINNLSNISVNRDNNSTIMQTPKASTSTAIKKTISTPITQYFKANKALPNKDTGKNSTRPKKANTTKNGTKPIETYFAKGKCNKNQLGVLAPPQAQNTITNNNILPEIEQDEITVVENDNTNSLTQTQILKNQKQFTFKIKPTKKEDLSQKKLQEITVVENDNTNSLTQTLIMNNQKQFTFKMTPIKKDLTKKKTPNNKFNTFDRFDQCLKAVRESSNSSTPTQNDELINQNNNKIINPNKEKDSIIEEFDNIEMENYDVPENFDFNQDNNNIVQNNNEILNFDSMNQNLNNSINFEDFSFFENCSQKTKGNDYNTDFYPSNLSDIFNSPSLNYSQFNILNNKNKINENAKLHQTPISEYKLQDKFNRILPNTNTTSSQYSNSSQSKTQTILNRNKLNISNSQNVPKQTNKLVSHITSKNFLSTYRKSVESTPKKNLEVLSQFEYTPKKKFQHSQQKTQNYENIFEPEVILEINDEPDNRTTPEVNNYKVIEIISKDTYIEKVKNNEPKINFDYIKKQNINETNRFVSSKTILNNRKDDHEQNKLLQNLKNNNKKEIDIKVSQISTKKNEFKDEVKIEKPAFPKSFTEYVQQTIKKIKTNTLVNEHYNYDIGFEEFLMAPLNQNFEDSESEDNSQEKVYSNSEKTTLNQKYPKQTKIPEITEKETEQTQLNSTFTLKSPNFTQMIPINTQNSLSSNMKQSIQNTPNNDKSYDFDNITFVSQISGSFNENCSINIEDENNFMEETTELSSVSSKNSDCTNPGLRIENKSKIIEQWIDSQVTQTIQNTQNNDEHNIPNKKIRLSTPLIYSKNSNATKNEENKKITENIIQNKFFGINTEKQQQPELAEKTDDSTILKRSSYSSYCVEDETNYEVVIYQKQESFVTKTSYLENECNSSNVTNFWPSQTEKKNNDNKKMFSFSNNVFF